MTTQLDPAKSIDLIGKIAVNEIHQVENELDAEYKELKAGIKELIEAVEAATLDKANVVAAFRNRMNSIATSIAALSSHVLTSPPTAAGDEGTEIPSFMLRPLVPPPERQGYVDKLNEVINGPLASGGIVPAQD